MVCYREAHDAMNWSAWLSNSKLRWIVLFSLICWPASNFAAQISAAKAGFTVRANGLNISYKIMSLFVLPKEKIDLEIVSPELSGHYRLQASRVQERWSGENRWQLQAPEQTGVYTLTLTDSQQIRSMTLNLFVMVPFNALRGEYLNGYRIGTYPKSSHKKLPIYNPPRGFLEITQTNADSQLSPHFKVRQFLCKQQGGFPKYLVLEERLLLKLELILEKVNQKGYPCQTFQIMSGYRTPYYNKTIGNVKYSCHIYGGAADIFIDEDPKNDAMDDLNRDGRVDYRDAAVLYDIVDNLYGQEFYELLVGGLGRYKRTNHHGPFVHVDVRGLRARWGY
jgi:Peptidase M15